MKPIEYLSELRLQCGKVNLACTCKMSRLEKDGMGNYIMKRYTFNEVRANLYEWLEKCDNEKWCEEIFEILQKCKCL